jgi:hypothetical protein
MGDFEVTVDRTGMLIDSPAEGVCPVCGLIGVCVTMTAGSTFSTTARFKGVCYPTASAELRQIIFHDRFA